MFKTKERINSELPNLKNFTLFRESMPFFDNPKYKLKGEEREHLLTILNSDKTTLETIRKLQKNHRR